MATKAKTTNEAVTEATAAFLKKQADLEKEKSDLLEAAIAKGNGAAQEATALGAPYRFVKAERKPRGPNRAKTADTSSQDGSGEPRTPANLTKEGADANQSTA